MHWTEKLLLNLFKNFQQDNLSFFPPYGLELLSISRVRRGNLGIFLVLVRIYYTRTSLLFFFLSRLGPVSSTTWASLSLSLSLSLSIVTGQEITFYNEIKWFSIFMSWDDIQEKHYKNLKTNFLTNCNLESNNFKPILSCRNKWALSILLNQKLNSKTELDPESGSSWSGLS